MGSKDLTNGGMGRILKSSLAKALDPVKRERRKENQGVLLKRDVGEEDKDDLSPFILRALNNIGSHGRNNTDGVKGCVDQSAAQPIETSTYHEGKTVSEEKKQSESSTMDAYDRWKLARYKKLPFKSNRVEVDAQKSSHRKDIPFDGCNTNGLSQHGCHVVTSRKSDSNKHRNNSRDVTPAATDDAVEDWDKEINDDRPQTGSQFPESALNKIQNIFSSYTSPVNVTSQMIDSLPTDNAFNQSYDDSKCAENVDSSERVSRQECKKGNNKKLDTEDSKHNVDTSHDTLLKPMEDLHVSEEGNDKENHLKNCDKSPTYQDVHASSHYGNNTRTSQPQNSSPKLLRKSPAISPPRSKSVAVLSQSDENTESPSPPPPPTRNLFPSQSQSTNRDPPMPEGQGYSKHRPVTWDGQYPHYYPVPFHHGQYYGHPYIPHQSYAGSGCMDPSPFFTKQTQRVPTTLTIPSETFSDKSSMDKLLEFVSTKTDEWNNFMKFHHGYTAPVDVIIDVRLSNNTDDRVPTDASSTMPPFSYPTQEGQFPMYQSNIAYYQRPYWPQPYYYQSADNLQHGESQPPQEFQANVHDTGDNHHCTERQKETKTNQNSCLEEMRQESSPGDSSVSRNWAEESPVNVESELKQFPSSPDIGVSCQEEASCLRKLRRDNIVSRDSDEESPDVTYDNGTASAVSESQKFSSSLDGGFSTQDQFNSYRTRKSGYSPNDHSSRTRNQRFYKTSPESKRDSKYQLDEEAGMWRKSLVTRSKSYSHQFIDCHCHIDFLYQRTKTRTMPFKQFVDENADSFPINYEGCVAVFCNPEVFNDRSPSNSVLKLLAKEGKVWVAVGCHPKNAMDFRNSDIDCLRYILEEHPKVVALGEIGLDYSGTFYQYAERQKEIFIQQLNLALELNLPLVIHCRDADADCLKIMKETVPANHKIHLHCFTRSINIARQWMKNFPNLCIGFTPLITYASAKEATEAATLIPLDRILLETDSPYFVPTGVPIDQVKGVSHPGFALYTAERLAQLKGVSVDTVLEACRENTTFIYGI